MLQPRTPRRARRVLASVGAGTLACLCVVAASRTASAQRRVYVYEEPPPPPPPRARYYYYDEQEPPQMLALGIDLEGAAPVNVPLFRDGNQLQGGGGIKVRVGERIRIRRRVWFTPEVGYAYDHLFASDDVGDSYDWDMHRVFAGARLAFGRILVPVIYAHVGYGWRDTGDPTVPQANGIAFDVGGGLDLHLIPHFAFGAHVEYAEIDAQPYTPQWVALGLHADLLF